jgi:transmembrane sensor
MISATGKSDHDARRTARAEAAAWVVRLHGPQRSPEIEAGFREWLAGDPEHARQFERVTDVWDAGARVPVNGLPRVRAAWRAPAARGWAVAAACALACLGVAWFARGSLRPGTAYSSRIGELRVVQLKDGSAISLDSDSAIRVAYSDTERRVQLDRGQAYFDVKANPGWPFVVVAGRHQITDMGTVFVVRYDPALTVVTLVKGRIAVSSRFQGTGSADSAGAHVLAAGQRLTFAGDGPPKLDQPRLDEVTAWQRGEVMLDDTPLTRAVAELNRYDTDSLVIGNPQVARLRVSGIYHTGNNREFALLLDRLYGIQFSERDGRIMLGAPATSAH